jgi:hypothetical protein
MRSSDFDAFSALLSDVWSLKGQALSGGAKAMWFRAMSAYPLEVVQGALDAHLSDPKRGQFLPMPADVVAQIDRLVADDGRPGAEEAWALALRSTDEGDTIVWTAEAAEAMGICSPILNAGDEVGARMAFKEGYTRLVDAARRTRTGPKWSASLGHDPERRDKAIAAAVTAGQLEHSAYAALPAPRGPVHLLEHASQHGIPENARAALLALRDWLTAPSDETSEDFHAKAETQARKAAAAAKVERYTVPVPSTPPVKHWSETDADGELH